MTASLLPTFARPFDTALLAVEPLGESVVRLRLAPESGRSMSYREGQFLTVELPDGDLRSYSMAAPVCDDGTLELHIRLYPNGKFSSLLRDRLGAGDKLKVHGPFGDCTWQAPSSSQTPVLMLATGTGIAPLKALLEAALRAGCANPIWVYWGGRKAEDFYLSAHFNALTRWHRNLRFITVVAPDGDPCWTGERGYVQDVAARRHPNLDGACVYVCGAPAMVSAARTRLIDDCRLCAQNFHADAFVSSTAPPADPFSATTAISVLLSSAHDGRREMDLPSGQSLMVSLRDAGLIQGVCGGNQSCGTCRVTLDPASFSRLKPIERTERRLLQALEGCGPYDRLSCQIRVEADLHGISIELLQTSPTPIHEEVKAT